MVPSPPSYANPRPRPPTRRPSEVKAMLPLALSSPRGPMPRDVNAFCYQMDHITEWLMPESIYSALPTDLKARIKNMQQSGAALITSMERLDELRAQLPPPGIDAGEETEATLEDLSDPEFPLAAVNGKLYEFQARRRASENAKYKYDCIPIPLEYRSFGSVSDNVFSSDQNTPNTNLTGCSSPMSLSLSTQPDSPAALDIGQPILSRRPSNKVAGPPDNAQIGHYWAQLVHLRQTDIVRLRHSIRPVDIEFNILGRPFSHSLPNSSPNSPADNVNTDAAQLSEIDFAYQIWWPEKKAKAMALMEKCQGIDAHVKPNLSCWTDVPMTQC